MATQTQSKHYKSRHADEKQKECYQNFSRSDFLGKEVNLDHVYLWNTFLRRNLHRVAIDYLGIGLHIYQAIILYMMGICQFIVIIASRAAAKSFIIALYACCRCIVYPNTKIVLASATRGQSKLIISEKIQNELMNMSPMLRKEIVSIKNNQNETIVHFRSKSTITVVTASDNSRGYRSNCIIREEFRQIDKSVDDSVLSPFQVVRQSPYILDPFYESNPDAKDESVDIYISSSWFSNHWMWDIADQAYDGMISGGNKCLLAFDESVILKHNIKSMAYMRNERKKQDALTWQIEFLNMKVLQNVAAFFPYDLFKQNQVCRQPWYPRFDYDVLSGRKNPYDIPKQSGEIRVLGADIAFVSNSVNDNSVFTIARLLPEKSTNGVSYYRMIVIYMEAMQGGEIQSQALRLRQLYEDARCDYIALDTRNGGIAILDLLGKVLYDTGRRIEYSPLSCMNNDNFASRASTGNATPCIFAINATQQLNSDIAVNFRRMLAEKRIELLVPFQTAQDEILSANRDYLIAPDADTQIFYERPFLETQALINESCALVYEKKAQTGAIVISEQGNNRKDRYTSCSYLAWLCNNLELDLLNVSEDYEFSVIINEGGRING